MGTITEIPLGSQELLELISEKATKSLANGEVFPGANSGNLIEMCHSLLEINPNIANVATSFDPKTNRKFAKRLNFCRDNSHTPIYPVSPTKTKRRPNLLNSREYEDGVKEFIQNLIKDTRSLLWLNPQSLSSEIFDQETAEVFNKHFNEIEVPTILGFCDDKKWDNNPFLKAFLNNKKSLVFVWPDSIELTFSFYFANGNIREIAYPKMLSIPYHTKGQKVMMAIEPQDTEAMAIQMAVMFRFLEKIRCSHIVLS